MASTSANVIIAAVVLSCCILGEQFIVRYDLPAIIFITLGCGTLVMNANMEQTSYTAEEVKDLMTSSRTLCFIGF